MSTDSKHLTKNLFFLSCSDFAKLGKDKNVKFFIFEEMFNFVIFKKVLTLITAQQPMIKWIKST